MCVAIPGQVIAIEAEGARILISGRERRAETLLVPEVAPGDYVIVAGGLIIARLSEDEALARLSLFADLDETVEA